MNFEVDSIEKHEKKSEAPFTAKTKPIAQKWTNQKQGEKVRAKTRLGQH